MPASESSRARAGIGTMLPLENMPCMRITIGHLPVSGSKPFGRVMFMAMPPCGPWTLKSRAPAAVVIRTRRMVMKCFMVFSFKDGDFSGECKGGVDASNETVWATQKAMAELFGVSISGISRHLVNIFSSGECIRTDISDLGWTGTLSKRYGILVKVVENLINRKQ